MTDDASRSAVTGRVSTLHPAHKELTGIDVFLHWRGRPDVLGPQLAALDGDGLALTMVTNRGVKVYPDGLPETFCTDHWRCRFMAPAGKTATRSQVLSLLMRVGNAGLDFVKTEHLYTFDGQTGFSLGQGQ